MSFTLNDEIVVASAREVDGFDEAREMYSVRTSVNGRNGGRISSAAPHLDQTLPSSRFGSSSDLKCPDDTSPYSGNTVDGKIPVQTSDDGEKSYMSSIFSNRFTETVQRAIPYGGLLSNAYNLASSTLGSGIIALPAAFNQAGYGVAIIVLVFCTWATVYSMYLLAVVIEKTRLESYEKMTRGLLGRGWDYFSAFLMWLFCFGSCVSYVISVGDLLTPVLRPVDTKGNVIILDSLPEYLQTKAGNRCLTSLVWICIMLPLSLPKEINSLRYASVIGVTCMMYFVICVIVHSVSGFKDGRSTQDMVAFKTGNEVVVGFSLFLFSYLCHPNFFKVYEEMKDPSPAHFSLHCGISMSVCCGLYLIAGMLGYADFGSAITDSILLYYNVREDIMIAVAYFGVGFKLCVGFALGMQPCRDSLYYVCNINLHKIAWWKNWLVCTTMAVAALVLGLFIPSVTVVFGLTGSFCGGIIGFIFPAYFVMYSGDWGLKQVGWFHYISTYILLISGVIALVFGTVASIYGEIV